MVTRTDRKNRKQTLNNQRQRFKKDKQRNFLAEPGPLEVVIVLDGLKPNFNIGKIFRSADAFGARKIHLVGIDFFDPAPAKGSFRHVPAIFDERFDTAHNTLSKDGYTLFAFTPHGGRPLHEVHIPARSGFIFGHEEFGFSFDVKEYPKLQPVYIQQVGRVESLNVSVAASIALYEYTRQNNLLTARK